MRGLRSDDNHQAVSKYPHTHQQIRQGQPELQHTYHPVIVIVAVEKKGVFAVSLWKDTIF